MTTITKEFTKEQLIAKAQEQIEFIRRTQVTGVGREHVDMCGELFEIALASLEAVPVASCIIEDGGMCVDGFGEYVGHSLPDGTHQLYTAPPAPVLPEEMPKGLAGKIVSLLVHNIGDKFLAQKIWNACRAAMLNGDTFRENSISSTNNFREIAETSTNSPVIPDEKGASLQLRTLIRQRHAKWSDKTFGNVGPVGPLKHLSKEALEAAAEPDDLSEWADMQFLLWDAQRRAGISDGEITAAMEEKLKVNMARQWPEPKDGEPRRHLKESDSSPLTPEGTTCKYRGGAGYFRRKKSANTFPFPCMGCTEIPVWQDIPRYAGGKP